MAKKQQPEHVKLPQPIQGDGDNAMPKTDKASNPEKTFYYDVSQDKEEEKKLLNPRCASCLAFCWGCTALRVYLCHY